MKYKVELDNQLDGKVKKVWYDRAVSVVQNTKTILLETHNNP